MYIPDSPILLWVTSSLKRVKPELLVIVILILILNLILIHYHHNHSHIHQFGLIYELLFYPYPTYLQLRVGQCKAISLSTAYKDINRSTIQWYVNQTYLRIACLVISYNANTLRCCITLHPLLFQPIIYIHSGYPLVGNRLCVDLGLPKEAIRYIKGKLTSFFLPTSLNNPLIVFLQEIPLLIDWMRWIQSRYTFTRFLLMHCRPETNHCRTIYTILLRLFWKTNNKEILL